MRGKIKAIIALIMGLTLTMVSIPAYAAYTPSSLSIGEATINSTLSFED